MEQKKNPKYDLERKRGMFFNLGLLASITLMITAFEWKTTEKGIDVFTENFDIEELVDIKPTIIPPPPKPKPIMPIVKEVPDKEIIEDIDIPIDNDFNDSTSIPEMVIEDDSKEEYIDPNKIWVGIIESPAEPVGGIDAFYRFIGKNLKYPRTAKRMNIQGRVFVQFVVDKDGSLTDIKAIKGLGGGCNEEAVRVFKKAPKWRPGKQRGRPVRVRMVMPIVFRLE